MAQEQQPQQQEQLLTQLAALYPAPPPFYKSFSKQNINELKRLRKDAAVSASKAGQANGDQSNGEAKKDLDILSLPPELRYLIPPQPPADGIYTSFGQQKSLEPKTFTLTDHGVEQLYPDHPSVHKNPQPHLIALARSMLTKYLHILGVLSNNPENYEQSTKELETIVYNMHDLINKYRPHQARETLILMMEERVEKLREEIGGIDEGAGRAKDLMQGFEGDAERLDQGGGERREEEGRDGKAKDLEASRKVRQDNAWEALDREMGDG